MVPCPASQPTDIWPVDPRYRAFDEVGFTLILTCITITAFFLTWHFIAGRLAIIDLVRFAVLQLPLLVPFVQVEIMRNHTIIHSGFVSRTFVLFGVLPLLAALAVCRSPAMT